MPWFVPQAPNWKGDTATKQDILVPLDRPCASSEKASHQPALEQSSLLALLENLGRMLGTSPLPTFSYLSGPQVSKGTVGIWGLGRQVFETG